MEGSPADVARLTAELDEAIVQQTAMREVLKIISRSTFQLEPVLDVLIAHATRLCDAEKGFVFRADGDVYRLAASHNASPEYRRFIEAHPIVPGRDTLVGRVALERRTIHIYDAVADPEYRWTESQRLGGFRTMLGVPMLRNGLPVGVIAIWREEVRPFSARQITLVTTFADQAVIALENARLLGELTLRSEQLGSAVDRLRALTEVSRAVTSTLDLDAVLTTVVARTVDLSGCDAGAIYELNSSMGEFQLRATNRMSAELVEAIQETRLRLGEGAVGRAAAERRAVQIADIAGEPAYPLAPMLERAGFRALLAMPLLREERIIGGLVVRRRLPGIFPPEVVDLLQTFATHSALAIENARLFSEVERRGRELERSADTLQQLYQLSIAMQESLSLDEQLARVFESARHVIGIDRFLTWTTTPDGERFTILAGAGFLEDEWREIRGLRIPADGVPAIAKAFRDGALLSFNDDHPVPPDLRLRPPYDAVRPLRSNNLAIVPMVSRGRVVGVLTVDNRSSRVPLSRSVLDLLRAFASHAAVAVDNARLFQALETKSRELDLANRHKSQFLANMSHEIRTPLNAIIGFSDVLLERMFGDLNDKQLEYLGDIAGSAQHLLSLINDILDLSKVEAGRMELELASFDLAATLQGAVVLVAERAQRHAIRLDLVLEPGLGRVIADERKVRQVVLNLLSNAVKFTPDAGVVTLSASRLIDGVEIAVSDTGIGISKEDQAVLFEEFRQVGHDSARKSEGTGLGLTLARKLVELHGGTIRVASDVGKGTTFTFTIPRVVPCGPG